MNLTGVTLSSGSAGIYFFHPYLEQPVKRISYSCAAHCYLLIPPYATAMHRTASTGMQRHTAAQHRTALNGKNKLPGQNDVHSLDRGRINRSLPLAPMIMTTTAYAPHSGQPASPASPRHSRFRAFRSSRIHASHAFNIHAIHAIQYAYSSSRNCQHHSRTPHSTISVNPQLPTSYKKSVPNGGPAKKEKRNRHYQYHVPIIPVYRTGHIHLTSQYEPAKTILFLTWYPAHVPIIPI